MSTVSNGVAHPSPAPSSPSLSPSSTSHLQPVPDRFPLPPPGVSQLLILGSGSSTGVPRGSCILQDDIQCRTCRLAMQGRPEDNRNWRSNPSILLRYAHPTLGYRHIQVDAGKTFRETMLRWYPRYRVHGLHALLLSHEHADAAFGLDDLRSLQRFNEQTGVPLTGAIPIHLSAHSFASIESRFGYLVDKSVSTSLIRRVAQLTYHLHEPMDTFDVDGLDVCALPVEHGPDYTAWGFAFGKGHLVYISDMSKLTPETEGYLQGLLEEGKGAAACKSCALERRERTVSGERSAMHLLVIDSLFVERPHPTHISMLQALDVIRKYRPHRALLIGLSDDFEYGVVSERLRQVREEEGIDVQLCYDGLSVNLAL